MMLLSFLAAVAVIAVSLFLGRVLYRNSKQYKRELRFAYAQGSISVSGQFRSLLDTFIEKGLFTEEQLNQAVSEHMGKAWTFNPSESETKEIVSGISKYITDGSLN